MKLISRRASLMVLVLAVGFLITRHALCYWCGYYQKSFTPIFYQELLALLGFILFLILLIICIVSLIQKKQRLWTTAMLVGLLAFMGLKYMVPWPHDLILYGMRDGMMRNYNLDDIRHFARDFDRLPRLPNTLESFKLYYWNQDLEKTGLKEKYPFLAKCEAVVERDNRVEVSWGGFENHWGFAVAANDRRIDPQGLGSMNKIIRVSDDIFFQSDY